MSASAIVFVSKPSPMPVPSKRHTSAFFAISRSCIARDSPGFRLVARHVSGPGGAGGGVEAARRSLQHRLVFLQGLSRALHSPAADRPASRARAATPRESRVLVDGILMIGGSTQQTEPFVLLPFGQ